ncbi:MAG: cobyric acid synthase [Actinomycetota bacterium]|nr:cobyric acid synthase [Actinomycetota bacterium]
MSPPPPGASAARVPAGLRGALHVCGTTSDAGKSTLVTGICRLLARSGVSVAPFKAQNMALNSYVTPDGAEIGRAQGAQALAAGIEPEAAMNPVLLKPTGERSSQVVVLGRPIGVRSAADYQASKRELAGIVADSLAELRRRFDVVVCEGAGSPAEINLLDGDIVNLRLAADGGFGAVIVGDIDRGGVFAHLYGTVALLPDDLRATVRGFVVNRFRGDPALLGDAMTTLEARCGVPTLGVVPMLADLWLDAEDSVALDSAVPPAGPPLADGLDVAVVRLPRTSNFTDTDALSLEPGVIVRYVRHAAALGRPDLVIIPGSKETVRDLAWLRDAGFADAIAASGADVLGICSGYQMLGSSIDDAVESGAGRVEGLGWLGGVATRFEGDKHVRRRTGPAITGYQIHHGRVDGGPGWVHLDDGDEGTVSDDGRIRGTTLHGLFEHDAFRAGFLVELAERRAKRFVPAGVSFTAARTARFDRLADAIEAHLDVERLCDIITEGAIAREPTC